MNNADLFDPSASLAPINGAPNPNYTYFRAWMARNLNIGQSFFGNFDGTLAAYSRLDPDDQIRLNNAMQAWIKANPAVAAANQVKVANAGPVEQLEKLSTAEKIASSEVGSSLIDSADAVNKAVNPFQFIDSAKKLAVVGVVVLVAWFVVRPVLINKFSK